MQETEQADNRLLDLNAPVEGIELFQQGPTETVDTQHNTALQLFPDQMLNEPIIPEVPLVDKTDRKNVV